MRALPLGAKRERSRLLRRKSAVFAFAKDYFSAPHSFFPKKPKGFGKLGALAKNVIFARAEDYYIPYVTLSEPPKSGESNGSEHIRALAVCSQCCLTDCIRLSTFLAQLPRQARDETERHALPLLAFPTMGKVWKKAKKRKRRRRIICGGMFVIPLPSRRRPPLQYRAPLRGRRCAFAVRARQR